jgi:anti-anti-sigma factor
VVIVRGEVNLRSSPDLHAELLALVEKKPARIVLDLSGVDYMDSSGIGTLVEIKRRVDKYKGKFILAALRPRVRGLFEITRLEQFFTIAADAGEAATT